MRCLSALALALAASLPAAAGAQSTATSTTTTTTSTTTTVETTVAPDVGQPAPDFTLPWADATGARQGAASLKDLRGQVVVLAFYPKDRTTGCTAELTKFRDEYATLFGKGVVVIPVSADSIASHVAWSQEMKFPFALGADTDLAVATRYGSRMAGRPVSSRTVFVIDKAGRVAWRDLRFNALSEQAYADLAAAVAKVR